MRIFRVLILPVLALILCSQVYGQEASVRKDFLTRVKAQSDTLRAIEASFVQVRSMAILQKPQRAEGKFYFQKPTSMALHFLNGDYIVLNAKRYRLQQAGTSNGGRTKSNPMLKQMLGIVTSCVEGDFAQLEKTFTFTVAKEGNLYRLLLMPSRRVLRRFVEKINLDFEANHMSLDRMRITEPSGDYTQYSFSDKQFNGAIAPEVFSIAK